jgi:hypothetical protein
MVIPVPDARGCAAHTTLAASNIAAARIAPASSMIGDGRAISGSPYSSAATKT